MSEPVPVWFDEHDFIPVAFPPFGASARWRKFLALPADEFRECEARLAAAEGRVKALGEALADATLEIKWRASNDSDFFQADEEAHSDSMALVKKCEAVLRAALAATPPAAPATKENPK